MPVRVVKRDGKFRLAEPDGTLTAAVFPTRERAAAAMAAINIEEARSRGARIPRPRPRRGR